MTKSTPFFRAVARASVPLGACLLACVLQGALAGPAGAFTPSPSTPKGGGENTPLNLSSSSGVSHASSSGGASLVRTIVGLAIVIAVIWGLSWILKQVKNGRAESHPSSAGLSSVAALTLASGRSVHLVRAGSDYVLLGATEHGVAPIHRYSAEQARDAGLLPDLGGGEAALDVGLGEVPVGGVREIGVGEAPVDRSRVRISSRAASPVSGSRPDPMNMPAPSLRLLDRLREMTVRR